jgi:hypothetical protein
LKKVPSTICKRRRILETQSGAQSSKLKLKKKAIRYFGIFCKEEEKTPEDVAD